MINSGKLNKNSGGGIHFYNVFLNLQKYCAVHAFVAKSIDYDSYKDNSNIIKVPNIFFLLQPTYQLFLLIYLFYCSIKLKPDLFYVRQSPLTFTPFIVSKIRNIPYVIELNGLPLEDFEMRSTTNCLYNTIIKSIYILNQRIVYNNSDKIVAVTKGIKDKIKKDYNISENKLIVIENGVDTLKFTKKSKLSCTKKIGLSEEFRYVCFVGEFSPWHGIDILLESFPLVLNELKNVKLLLVGSGVMREKLIEIAKMRGIQSNVIFTGSVRHDSVPDYINSSDICVAPFIKERNENTGISPLKIYEYLACEKAVIASRIKNLEFLEENNLGILTEPDNSKMLAEAIVRLLKDEKFRNEMGRNGREYVATGHSWDAVSSRVEEVCEKIANEQRKK